MMKTERCYYAQSDSVKYCLWYGTKICQKNCNYAESKQLEINFESGIIEKSGLEKFIDNGSRKCRKW